MRIGCLFISAIEISARDLHMRRKKKTTAFSNGADLMFIYHQQRSDFQALKKLILGADFTQPGPGSATTGCPEGPGHRGGSSTSGADLGEAVDRLRGSWDFLRPVPLVLQ